MPFRRRLFLWRARRRAGTRRFAAFGVNSLIEAPVRVLGGHRIEIGDRVLIHSGAWFSVVEEHNGRRHDPHMSIGDGTVIGRDAWFSCVNRIEIGREVLAGDRLVISDSHHGYEDPDVSIARQPMAPGKPTRIGDGAFLSTSVTVLEGVTIGERAYIGASAVVTRDVPPNSVVAGNPARVLSQWDGERWVSVKEDSP